MRDDALALAQRGFRVMPLNGKIPLTDHGFYDATTDADAIREQWGRWPGADIGIRTGGGLSVLDVDPRHGGDCSLDDLEDEHGIIRTLTARTGGGGLHLYLAGDLPTRTGFLPGLDVKAAGGYVVAPPSMHATGRRYEWIPDHPTEPQPIPFWLAQLLNPPTRSTGTNWSHPPARDVSAPYIAAAIEAECLDVAHAPEGERNDTLNRAAYALARFVATGEADAAAVRQALVASARHAGLPEFEITRTIESAFRARKAA